MQCYVQDASSSASSGLSSSKKPRPGTQKKTMVVLLYGTLNPGTVDGCQLVMASGAPLGADPPRLVGRELIIAQANSCRNPQEAAGNCYSGPVYLYIKSKENHLFLVIHKKPGLHFNWFAYYIPTKLEIVRTGKTYVAPAGAKGQVIRFHVSCPTFRPKTNWSSSCRINLYILLRCVWWELFNISPHRTRQPSLEAPKSNTFLGRDLTFPGEYLGYSAWPRRFSVNWR